MIKTGKGLILTPSQLEESGCTRYKSTRSIARVLSEKFIIIIYHTAQESHPFHFGPGRLSLYCSVIHDNQAVWTNRDQADKRERRCYVG